MLRRLARTFGSTVFRSKRQLLSSAIRSREFTKIRIILSTSAARSLLVIQLPAGCYWYPLRSTGTRYESSVLGGPTPASVRNMKKTSSTHSKVSAARVRVPARRRVQESNDEMRPHYDFDYSKSRPNRFASRFAEGAVAVVLDPDVASVFRSSEAVNDFLRSAISAMPRARKKKRAV